MSFVNHIPKNIDPQSPDSLISLCGLKWNMKSHIFFSIIDPTCQQCLDIQNKVVTKSICAICDGEDNGTMIKWEGSVLHQTCYTKITEALKQKHEEEIANILTLARQK